MDLNHLNPSQIVLLTLLVSFVTSIATGIVTVTLMEQAPPTVAQTVNRIVERTVEKVVPSGQAAGAAVTEKTVIVTESDLIAQAVQETTPSIARLYVAAAGGADAESDVFLGFGVVAGSGRIVTDVAALPSNETIIVVLSDGTSTSATVQKRDATTGLALLQSVASTTEDIDWSPATFAHGEPTLGEVVVGISGRTATRIGNGIVTALSGGGSTTTVPTLETNVPSGAIAFGSILINVQGEVVGISTATSRKLSENAFIPASVISAYLVDEEAPEESAE